MTTKELSQRFPKAQWPLFESLNKNDNHVSLQINVHPDIHWFEGHFPDQPVLAGVVQTHWAGELGKYFFETGDEFCRIDNLKFQSVILPDMQLELILEYLVEKNSVKFQYRDQERIFSEGKIVFAKDAE
jgi:3-hydroxymyristoyl/3-hydroxydecanoyl-(acyl carrier protein) dehydratase